MLDVCHMACVENLWLDSQISKKKVQPRNIKRSFFFLNHWWWQFNKSWVIIKTTVPPRKSLDQSTNVWWFTSNSSVQSILHTKERKETMTCVTPTDTGSPPIPLLGSQQPPKCRCGPASLYSRPRPGSPSAASPQQPRAIKGVKRLHVFKTRWKAFSWKFFAPSFLTFLKRHPSKY